MIIHKNWNIHRAFLAACLMTILLGALLFLLDGRFFALSSGLKVFAIGLFFLNLFLTLFLAGWRESTLLSVFLLFYFTFGCIYPALIFIELRILPLHSIVRFTDEDILRGLLILWIGTVFFAAPLILLLRHSPRHTGTLQFKGYRCITFRCLPAIAVLTFFFALGLYFASYMGFDAITSTRMELKQGYEETETLELGFFKRAQFLFFSAAFMSVFLWRNACPGESSCKRIMLGGLALIFTLALFLAVNPFNSARWRLLGFALAMIFIFFQFRSSISRVAMVFALFIGMIIIYPLLNYLGRTADQWEKITGGEYADFFVAGDFDGFQSIINAIYLVEIEGFAYGKQLLGNLLAPLPRKMFEFKPTHSGELAGTVVNSVNTNLSMPLYGEFYIDFGLLGVAALAGALGVIVAKTEIAVRGATHINLFAYTTAIIVTANTLFITRGALMPATGNLFFILFANYIVLLIVRARITAPALLNLAPTSYRSRT